MVIAWQSQASQPGEPRGSRAATGRPGPSWGGPAAPGCDREHSRGKPPGPGCVMASPCVSWLMNRLSAPWRASASHIPGPGACCAHSHPASCSNPACGSQWPSTFGRTLTRGGRCPPGPGCGLVPLAPCPLLTSPVGPSMPRGLSQSCPCPSGPRSPQGPVAPQARP